MQAPIAGPMAMDWPAEYPPRSTVPAEGVRRDLFLVRGVTAPANPETGEATPEQLGYTQVVRSRHGARTGSRSWTNTCWRGLRLLILL